MKKKKSMWIKILLIPIFILLGLAIIVIGLTFPTWPSKSKLCHTLEGYISFGECIKMDNRVEMIHNAFPEGKATSEDVRSALGEYLAEQKNTVYGSLEVYFLSKQPINYINNYFDYYSFRYDKLGILVSFDYDDW